MPLIVRLDTVYEAHRQTHCNATMIFVPGPFAADAILEAADAGVELIVCITEGIPVMDMMRIKTDSIRQHMFRILRIQR